MNVARYILTFSLLLLSISPALRTDVIHVPDDQPTIQAGIEVAADGDTVMVADGTYTGDGNHDINFLGKAITVTSENGPADCIVDLLGYELGFIFENDEDQSSVLAGLTIRNAYSNPYYAGLGGGIFCYYVSPMIVNCILENNGAGAGGGIGCEGASPTIVDTRISGNWSCSGYSRTSGRGGGFASIAGSPVLINCIIMDNQVCALCCGGGIYCSDSSHLTIVNCTISNNECDFSWGWGGGIYCVSGSTISIVSSTITGNSAQDDGQGGGIYCHNSALTISNSILWDNVALEGSSIYIEGPPIPSVTYSDVEGGWVGEGNIDLDPLFATGPHGEFYLSQVAAGQPANSPCVDTGDPATDLIDGTTRTDCLADVEIVDMGYHYSSIQTVFANLSCLPDAGVLPFPSLFTVMIGNAVGYSRTVAGKVDINLAGGSNFSNWRAGYTNLDPAEKKVYSWSQMMPALSSLVGPSSFELHVEDVTPPPYNQPPYLPSGSTATATCTVTGDLP